MFDDFKNKDMLEKFRSDIENLSEEWKKENKLKYPIEDYVSVINSKQLSPSQMKIILKWKFGNKNWLRKILDKLLNKDGLEKINYFKNSQITKDGEKSFDKFLNTVCGEKKVVLNVFIKHICKPKNYPIVDYHTMATFLYFKYGDLIRKRNYKVEKAIKTKYDEYREFFQNLSKVIKAQSHFEMKELDNALFQYHKEIIKKVKISPK